MPKKIAQEVIAGQKYRHLTPLKVAGRDKHGHITWLCKCDCGESKEVAATYLTRGLIVSCGCIFREKAAKKDGNLKKVIREYKIGSRRRGHTWELRDEEAVQLFKGNCFYCGTEPSNVRAQYKKSHSFIFNGIDRLNPAIGYTLENCASCCTKCNYIKNTMTLEEFEEYVTVLYNNIIKRRESKP